MYTARRCELITFAHVSKRVRVYLPVNSLIWPIRLLVQYLGTYGRCAPSAFRTTAEGVVIRSAIEWAAH